MTSPKTRPTASVTADLGEAVHRCLILGWDAPVVTDELRRRVDNGLGGVILHTRNVTDTAQLRALTDELRALRSDFLVAIDQEGGRIGHLERAQVPASPAHWALGVADDPELTARVARTLAGHLAALGIMVSYAPVADVQREDANPIIRTRSFGADPELVSRHVAAWVEGTLAAGVAPCAKHFPGHGSTTVDSHLGVAVDTRDLATLSEVDLAPFRAAIAAGVPQIMTAHVSFPELDELPATLSRRVLVDVLRAELGFTGVIVTDALEMKAIADRYGEAAGAWMAFAAGADQLIIAEPDDGLHERCVAAVVQAVADGALAEERVFEAAQRVAALAARFAQPPASTSTVDDERHEPGLAAARRAVRRTPLPAPLRAPFVVDLYRAPRPALEWDGSDLVTHVRALDPDADGVGITAGPVDVAGLLARAANRPLVIATEDANLHDWQRQARDALLAGRPDARLVETGLPDSAATATSTDAADTPAPALIRAYGRGHASLRATAEAVVGR
ncbi:beta-N-acetylhexosaminidase [Goodfellowiella coeruleoviolacea]|uniref:Beta-N-acetylhexosaminidase n=1 Tax=Goodfellowiella coeruleoviolacea TaxID=334858 RepID=A0AAE3GAQ1_9PSEU|nr:beta-N-acetylhexosaminidase [Goodfellowiella coeruleoviolacea]MCP2163959.1 beta-N-acetylhexosaminidase [Goodfellowiella coeruleoviolacea]